MLNCHCTANEWAVLSMSTDGMYTHFPYDEKFKFCLSTRDDWTDRKVIISSNGGLWLTNGSKNSVGMEVGVYQPERERHHPLPGALYRDLPGWTVRHFTKRPPGRQNTSVRVVRTHFKILGKKLG